MPTLALSTAIAGGVRTMAAAKRPPTAPVAMVERQDDNVDAVDANGDSDSFVEMFWVPLWACMAWNPRLPWRFGVSIRQGCNPKECRDNA